MFSQSLVPLILRHEYALGNSHRCHDCRREFLANSDKCPHCGSMWMTSLRNDSNLAQESMEEYADRFFAQGSRPLFVGVEPFQELFAAGRIYPFLNLIRVSPGGIMHLFYYTTQLGNLVERNHPDAIFEPEDILARKWGLESIAPKHLAEKRE